MESGKKYIDGRGWKYRVMDGISVCIGPCFNTCYQTPDCSGESGWQPVRRFPRHQTFEEAQANLDRIAAERGWRVWDGDGV